MKTDPLISLTHTHTTYTHSLLSLSRTFLHSPIASGGGVRWASLIRPARAQTRVKYRQSTAPPVKEERPKQKAMKGKYLRPRGGPAVIAGTTECQSCRRAPRKAAAAFRKGCGIVRRFHKELPSGIAVPLLKEQFLLHAGQADSGRVMQSPLTYTHTQN